MRILIFQHTSTEEPGTIVDWAKDRGYFFYIHHSYKNALEIPADNFDLLIVLGGPMNIDEEHLHPWLRDEKEFLKKWLNANKPMLGICLGGQMLAQVLGAKVVKNNDREIGFHPVKKTHHTHPAFNEWPEEVHVFQWHEDRFHLPEGCKTLLTNTVCEHQAFAWNQRTIGLQFHPESTARWILNNYENFPDTDEPYVQNSQKCLKILPKYLSPMTDHFFRFLDAFVKHAL